MTNFKTLGCPFCGGKELELFYYVDSVTSDVEFTVRCLRCQTRGPLAKSQDMAVVQWGSRCLNFPGAEIRGLENQTQKTGD